MIHNKTYFIVELNAVFQIALLSQLASINIILMDWNISSGDRNQFE